MRKKDNVGVTPSASAASTTSAASTAREMTVGAAEEKQEGQSSEANDLGLVEAFGPLYIA